MMRKPNIGDPPTSVFTRIAGVSCLGFAATIVLANVVDRVVDADGLVAALTPTAWVLSTLFGAGAVSALWRSERERGEAWSLVGFAGLLLQNGAFAAVVALRLALPSADRSAGLPALHDALFTLNGVFLALALTGLSVGGARSALIPRWHAALGLLSAALLFASATLAPLVVARPGPPGLLGLGGWLLWVGRLVAYGVALLRPGARVGQAVSARPGETMPCS